VRRYFRPLRQNTLFALAIHLLTVLLVFATSLLAAERENTKELEAKAIAGDTQSQYLMGLGNLPLTKKETEQNLEDAYAWLRAAAARGHYRAASQLDLVNRSLERTGRTEKAKTRYQEISALIASKPSEELTYRLIANAAIGYKFYISSRWGEPKTEGNTVTLQLKTGGTAWLMLDPCTREDDKDLRERIKSPDPVLAMSLVEVMKKQFGDARLIKHGPSDGSLKEKYYIMAAIPADKQYHPRTSLIVTWPGVDRLVTLQFITFEENAQSEVGDFIGLVETYSYTPPHLTKAMEDFVKGLSPKK
jgi:TPR repeat protein